MSSTMRAFRPIVPVHNDNDSDDEDLTIESNPLSDINPAILEYLSHLDLSDKINFSNGFRAQANGAYGDVSRGRLVNSAGKGMSVALKRLRFTYRQDIVTLFEKEIYVWSKLKHANVLPLLGFAFDASGYPLLVSPWMKRGSVASLISGNEEYDVERLAFGVAEGLKYLHENGVVHSDIKPHNIVVSKDDDAFICDFGCARMIEASRSLGVMSDGIKGTTLYMAYELLAREPSERTPYSKEADVWAFGMTIYELITRKRPYWHIIGREDEISASIKSRQIPRRPALLASQLEEVLWSICQQCWVHEPETRIQMPSVVEILQEFKQQTQRILSEPLHSKQFEEAKQFTSDEPRTASHSVGRRSFVPDIGLQPPLYEVQSRIGQKNRNLPIPDIWEYAEIHDDDEPTFYCTLSNVVVCKSSEENSFAISTVGYIPDSNRIVSGCDDGIIRLWDARIADVSERKPVAERGIGILSMAVAPDGRRIAAGCSDGTIRLVDLQSEARPAEVWEGHNGRVLSLAFSPDGSRIASGSDDMTIRIWDARSGVTVAGPLEGHTERITSVVFSSDSQLVVSGSHDKTIRLWDIQTGMIGRGPIEHASRIFCTAFSPDGRHIAAGLEDATIRLWDFKTETEEIILQGHLGRVLSVAFSPDGTHIVSGSEDETARLWHVDSRTAVGNPLESRMGIVLSVAFSGDGRQVAAASARGIHVITVEGRSKAGATS